MKLCVISAIFSKDGIPIDFPYVIDKIPNADYILFTNCESLLNIKYWMEYYNKTN